MPDALWDSFVITTMTPMIYAFVIYYPMTTSLIMAVILHKSDK